MFLSHLKYFLKNTPMYGIWAVFQAHRQRKCFDRLLDRIHQTDLSVQSLEAALDSRRAKRLTISNKPHVLGIGHKAWERYGLWPSLNRVAKFNFYEIGNLSQSYDDAARKAEGIKILNLVDEMERQGNQVDVVFIYADSSFLSLEMLNGLAARRIWTVLMGLDDKHRLEPRLEGRVIVGQEIVAPQVDIYWTTWKMAIPYLWRIGARPLYLAEGADPVFHSKKDLKRDIDILFLGACYGIRKKLIMYLQRRGLNVSAYGKGWPNGYVTFEKSVELINRAKVVLGVGGVGHLDEVQHLKGRDFEVPMCGAVYLTTYNPELCDWYQVGEEILCYSSFQNCAEILINLLSDSKKLEKIRGTVSNIAQKKHTWENRFQELFNLLKSKNNE